MEVELVFWGARGLPELCTGLCTAVHRSKTSQNAGIIKGFRMSVFATFLLNFTYFHEFVHRPVHRKLPRMQAL